MAETVLSISHLTKRFDDQTILENLNLMDILVGIVIDVLVPYRLEPGVCYRGDEKTAR